MITRADLLGRGRIRIQSVYITDFLCICITAFIMIRVIILIDHIIERLFEPDCYRCIVFKFSVAV